MKSVLFVIFGTLLLSQSANAGAKCEEQFVCLVSKKATYEFVANYFGSTLRDAQGSVPRDYYRIHNVSCGVCQQ